MKRVPGFSPPPDPATTSLLTGLLIPILSTETMPLSDYRDHFGPPPLDPDELQKVERVFEQAMRLNGYEKSSREAEQVAASLLQLYHLGFRDEEQLLRMSAGLRMP